MGAHSTMLITASDARKKLLMKVLEADDKTLESMMDSAFYDRLYNFTIVPDYTDIDEGRITFLNSGYGLD